MFTVTCIASFPKDNKVTERLAKVFEKTGVKWFDQCLKMEQEVKDDKVHIVVTVSYEPRTSADKVTRKPLLDKVMILVAIIINSTGLLEPDDRNVLQDIRLTALEDLVDYVKRDPELEEKKEYYEIKAKLDLAISKKSVE